MSNHQLFAKRTWTVSSVGLLFLAAILAYFRPSGQPIPSGGAKPPSAPEARHDPAGAILRGHVSFVPDGDTIVVRVGDKDVRVRLYGIDSPEGNTKQPYATQARDYARKLADKQKVELLVRNHDQYGRTVAEVILPGGIHMNQEMVKAGLAWHYKSHAKHDDSLARLESDARSARRGLWADPNPVPPWQWRKEHAKP